MAGGRFKELIKKYGKVALGVHFSVSAASISGLYVAIRNNVDVESLFATWHLPGLSSENPDVVSNSLSQSPDEFLLETPDVHCDAGLGGIIISGGGELTVVIREEGKKERNRTVELAASSGGALALAVLCNKALFPIRVPITIALTPPLARFLARRRIFKTSV